MFNSDQTALSLFDLCLCVFVMTKVFRKGVKIPKALKMVPVATLLGTQHYKASTGFSSPNKYCTTNIATLTKIKKV